MSIDRKQKFQRFRRILKPPYDESPSLSFPIFTTDEFFRLEDYDSESANHSVDSFDHLAKALPDEFFMDLGCGRRSVTLDNVLYVEVYPSVSADLIVAPDCRYPIRDASLRGIGCFAVLEHTRKPWVVVREMHRMLKPGGQVFIDWPFLQPVHGYPSHFFNATREGLTSIFEDEGFKVDHAFTGAHQTAAYSVQWLLGRFAHHLRVAGDVKLLREFAEMRVSDLVSMSQQDPLWWKFLNALSPEAFAELACGNMLFATKA